MVVDFDWLKRKVYIGVDLSQTTDNTAVSMVAYDWDSNEYICKAWAFLPEDNAANKTKIEKVDYFMMRDNGYAFFCGDRVINYRFIEDFVIGLEEEYGVQIQGIGYD